MNNNRTIIKTRALWLRTVVANTGFTLIEAVIAISIVGIIGIVMSDVLSRAFDNTQKTNLISNIQQNGQAALSSFENAIHYAQFVCVGGNTSSGTPATPNQVLFAYQSPILVVFKDGKFIRFTITPQTATQNGVIIEDFPLAPGANSSAIDLCNGTVPLVNQRNITNNTVLSVKRGSVTLLSNPVNYQATAQTVGTSKVSVSIVFALGAAVNASQTVQTQLGQNNETVFQTTTQFR